MGLLANEAGSVSKARGIQEDDPSRSLQRALIGAVVILAVVIGIVLVLLVNWMNF